MLVYLMDAVGYLVPGLIFAAVYMGLCFAIIKICKGSRSFGFWLLMLLQGIYLIVLFAITVSPTYGFHPNIDVSVIKWDVNLSLNNYFNSFQIIGNIIMFVPLGVLLPLAYKSFKNPLKCAITGLMISVIIEFLQLFLGRGTDVNDLICNTLGAFVGALFTRVFLSWILPGNKCARRGYYSDGLMFAGYVLVILLSVILTGFRLRSGIV